MAEELYFSPRFDQAEQLAKDFEFDLLFDRKLSHVSSSAIRQIESFKKV